MTCRPRLPMLVLGNGNPEMVCAPVASLPAVYTCARMPSLEPGRIGAGGMHEKMGWQKAEGVWLAWTARLCNGGMIWRRLAAWEA